MVKGYDINSWFHVPSCLEQLPLERKDGSPLPPGCHIHPPSTLISWKSKLLVRLIRVQDIPWAPVTSKQSSYILKVNTRCSLRANFKVRPAFLGRMAGSFSPASSMPVTGHIQPEEVRSFITTQTSFAPQQLPSSSVINKRDPLVFVGWYTRKC